MANKHSISYNPGPSGLTSRIHPAMSLAPLGLYLCSEFFLNVVVKLYIQLWLGKIFQFMMLRLLENAFTCQKKLKEGTFVHAPRQNSPTDSYLHPQTDGNQSFPQTEFFRKSISIQVERGEENYGGSNCSSNLYEVHTIKDQKNDTTNKPALIKGKRRMYPK